MSPQEVSCDRLDIALEQLHVAIALYLKRKHEVAAITLAGAAEEILGKHCEALGRTSSVKRRAKAAQDLYSFLWPNRSTPEDRTFIDQRNRARNQAKHYDAGTSISCDWRREAEKMITRAIDNYRSLRRRETLPMRRFLAQKHQGP